MKSVINNYVSQVNNLEKDIREKNEESGYSRKQSMIGLNSTRRRLRRKKRLSRNSKRHITRCLLDSRVFYKGQRINYRKE
jgi:hypothetical protein